MKQQEQRYMVQRMKEMLCGKQSVLRDELTTPTVSLDLRAKVALVRKGDVGPRPDRQIRYSRFVDWDDVFDFSKFEEEGGLDQEAFDLRNEKLKATFHSATDEAMLGDSEKALRMLRTFTEFKA